jgi:thioredoxin-dependent peroxiredoxin
MHTGRTSPQQKEETMIEAGGPAPDFTLPDQDGRSVSLSSFRGGTVVLCFYPKADTPGCTAQACGVRDHSGDYDLAGATVLGVPPDPVAELKAFARKHRLSFRLLSDESHRVAERCGVWAELSVGDRAVRGNQRSTVLIGPDGIITRVFDRVTPELHDDQVLGALREGAARPG